MDVRAVLLKILQATLNNCEVDIDENIDGKQIVTLAGIQGVQVIAFPIIKKLFLSGKVNLEKDDFLDLEKSVNISILRYNQRQFAAYKLLEKMKATGIDYIVLKGDTLSTAYPFSDYRMSNDTDILISPEEEQKCFKFFENNGATVERRTQDNNESVVKHKIAGIIEIHVALNTKTVSEIWYENIEIQQEEPIEVRIFDHFNVKMLGYTDTAINLLLHVHKHFISGIAHLRMITDALAFLNKYYSNVDINRVENVMSKLGFTKFYEAMMYIGHNYFGLENLRCNNDYEKIAFDLINNVFDCGFYGFDKLEKSDEYSYYSEKRFMERQNKNFSEYQKEIIETNYFKILFLDRAKMTKKYKILEKHKNMLCIMYIYRIFELIFIRPFRKKTPSVDTEFSQKRRKVIDEIM